MKFDKVVLLLMAFESAQSVLRAPSRCQRKLCILQRQLESLIGNQVQCPSLGSPDNGTVSVSGPQVPGITATYSCDYGPLSGDLVRYCLIDGNWTGAEPQCASGLAGDCKEVLDLGSTSSGVYTLYPCGTSSCPVTSYCDLTTDGGGWTVFQRRVDNTTDFYLNWADYKTGFGDPNANFWFGDSLTTTTSQNHNNQQFSTPDSDNDNRPGENCAIRHQGPWWHNNCHRSNLNGRYLGGTFSGSYADGIIWYTWKDYAYSLKTSKMMVRELSN